MTTYGGGPKTGHKMKLYRNFGTRASESLVEVAEIEMANLDENALTTADLKRRASNRTKALPGTFEKIGISFKLIHGLDKAIFEACLDDFRLMRAKEWVIADGPIATTGTYGLRVPCLLTEFPWNQDMEEVSGHDVKLTEAYMEEAGEELDAIWVEIGGTVGSSA